MKCFLCNSSLELRDDGRYECSKCGAAFSKDDLKLTRKEFFQKMKGYSYVFSQG